MKKHIANNQYLKQIIEIEEFSGKSFQEQINAIDNLFYTYIQVCLHKGSDILISQNEVYEIKEAKKTLKLLGQWLKEIE